MAEALKYHLNATVAARIARQVQSAHPTFDTQAFLATALHQFEHLALMPRAKHIAAALRQYLPEHYPQAIDILVASLGPKLPQPDNNGVAPLMYLPHVFFVSRYGLDFFAESMAAQYEITQRFTAEFSLRPFLQKYPEQSLAMLQRWATDPSVLVRRLVSEGTRPRLPWAARLPDFQRDPSPVIPLLEALKNDPELYVRRSVANHLNDIGKDNPDILMALAARWLQTPSPHILWLIKHALRFAVKAGDGRALALLGCGQTPDIVVQACTLTPTYARLGDTLCVHIQVHSTATTAQRLMVDLRVFYVKANGRTSPKVFKLKTLQLAAADTVQLNKKIPLMNRTTRQHHAGEHAVEILINGHSYPVGAFFLTL